MTRIDYAFKFDIGCEKYMISYEPPGDEWDAKRNSDPFFPISDMLEGTKRGPRIKIERFGKKSVIAGLTREGLDQLIEMFEQIRSYDNQIKEEWGKNA